MGSLIREYRQFPSGNTFKPSETVNNIADGTSITLNDPGPIFEAPPANSSFDYCIYSRVFWNANGNITTGSSLTVTVTGVTVATCWYQHGCSPGGDGTSITTYAFDANGNTEMSGTTPISSVNPSNLWVSGSNSVTPSNSGDITIDAKNAISGKNFTQWLLFGAGSVSSDDVIIPPKSGGFYVAIYKAPSGGTLVPGIFEDIFLERWPDLDIDWVVDPSPLDRYRLALIVSQLAARGEQTNPNLAGNAADARKQLARVRAELKRLEAQAADLEKQIASGKK
jgi:hypothetical protein